MVDSVMRLIGILFISLLSTLLTVSAHAQDTNQNSMHLGKDGFSQPINDPKYKKLTTYLVEMKDGNLMPAELVVPAKTKFRILVRNIGSKPAEFESNQLRQEKVLFMGAEINLVITPLDVGTYDYYDDFAPKTHGNITVKAKE